MNQCDKFSRNKSKHEYILNLGSCPGTVTMDIFLKNELEEWHDIPCRATILYKGESYTTGFVGNPSYNSDLVSLGLPEVQTEIYYVPGSEGGTFIAFEKTSDIEDTAKLIIETPLFNSSVSATLNCPICGDDSDVSDKVSVLCAGCRDNTDCPVEASTDFLRTPGFKDGEQSTTINLQLSEDTIIPISFGGLPIDSQNLGESDTIVARLNDVACGVSDSLPVPDTSTIPDDTTTAIQIVDLSLKSISTVTIGPNEFDVYVGLDKTVPLILGSEGEYLHGSGGSMSISYNEDFLGGLWSSNFNVNVVFVFVPQGSAASREPTLEEQEDGKFIFVGGEPDLVQNLIKENCPCLANLMENPDPDLIVEENGEHPCDGADEGCVPFLKEEFKAEEEPWVKTPASEFPHFIVSSENDRVNEFGTNDCNFFIEGQAVHDAGEGITHGVDGGREEVRVSIVDSGSGFIAGAPVGHFVFDKKNKKWIIVTK
jgi:hypothetical protein